VTAPRPTKGERTRARLTEAAATLLRRQGYHATALADVVATAEAPRGSLYFHFPGGKEDLACAALADTGAAWRARLEGVIARAPDVASAITAVCDELAAELVATDFREGCPLATVALEAAGTSEAVRATVAASYDAWLASIAARVTALGAPPAVAAAAGDVHAGRRRGRAAARQGAALDGAAGRRGRGAARGWWPRLPALPPACSVAAWRATAATRRPPAA
jgi:TetR/AcrR family transcriptional repressor of lmrAB and yxaGH operons